MFKTVPEHQFKLIWLFLYLIYGRSEDGKWQTTRYGTYLGLCIATCIIFQNNPVIASGVGLSVALYVTVSECMLGSMPADEMLTSPFKYFKT